MRTSEGCLQFFQSREWGCALCVESSTSSVCNKSSINVVRLFPWEFIASLQPPLGRWGVLPCPSAAPCARQVTPSAAKGVFSAGLVCWIFTESGCQSWCEGGDGWDGVVMMHCWSEWRGHLESWKVKVHWLVFFSCFIWTSFCRPSAGALLNHPFFKQVRRSLNAQVQNSGFSAVITLQRHQSWGWEFWAAEFSGTWND